MAFRRDWIPGWPSPQAHWEICCRKSELVGLCILVAIPLPGTGAWTGALVAALMEMRLKRALPAIYAGVLIAGLLVTLALTGVKALRFLA